MKKVIFVVLIEEIFDREMYMQYLSQVVDVIHAHHGEYVARSNNITPFVGESPQRSIIIAFNSMHAAQQCFHSSDYEKIQHLREKSTRTRAFFIENN